MTSTRPDLAPRTDNRTDTGGRELDHRLAQGAIGLLRTFNEAGVLAAADVHTAVRVARICGESDDAVQLAFALTVRALRVGSVCVDLRTVHETVFDEAEEAIDTADLPWPEPDQWMERVTASPAVRADPDGPGDRPLRWSYGLLYLERYWGQEEQVRRELQRRWAAEPPTVDDDRLRDGLTRLFTGDGLAPGETDRQQLAAAVSALSWVTVVAGGPGTGKTTTVARLLSLLRDQPGRVPRIALAAPTGKAAARLEEAVRDAARWLPPADRDRLGDLTASTVHRLLGWLPGHRGRFRHHGDNHLPYDVIVVDEMSMVSLSLMARLLEAVRPDARLVLVGDPDQLSSVEAGAVLADVTGAVQPIDAAKSARVESLTGAEVPTDRVSVAGGVVHLTHTWRYGERIGALARAIRDGDADTALTELRAGSDEVTFVETDLAVARPDGMDRLAAEVTSAGLAIDAAATAGDVTSAVAALDQHRLLCAHRLGPYGVSRWAHEATGWLTDAIEGYGQEGEWFAGRPVLITVNDRELELYNGDTGVVVRTPTGLRAAFARGGSPSLYAPVRLDTVQTVHAMTVHRAQGSQFECVSFIVPPVDSPLLTRELLYTAVTRASRRVQVFGSAEAIARAVTRPANRASGLRARLT
ncbi:MAG: exodeoxyribonuclease V subunit alpha [Propionibacteriaceae bacterium]